MLGRFGLNSYTYSMPWTSPYIAMANNPVMFADQDGNESIVLLVLGTAALVSKALTRGDFRNQ